MCGRYALHASPEVIALQFGLRTLPGCAARYNIAPGGSILVVSGEGGGRSAALWQWGLLPPWAKEGAEAKPLINARAETVAEKPAFRRAFAQGRCLVPASGYYEWQALAGGKRPFYIRPEGEALFGFAAVCALARDRATVAIITTAANELTRGIHERMPAILARGDYARWLAPNASAPELLALLRPYPSEAMAAYPVSTRVNAAGNDGAECVRPLPE